MGTNPKTCATKKEESFSFPCSSPSSSSNSTTSVMLHVDEVMMVIGNVLFRRIRVVLVIIVVDIIMLFKPCPIILSCAPAALFSFATSRILFSRERNHTRWVFDFGWCCHQKKTSLLDDGKMMMSSSVSARDEVRNFSFIFQSHICWDIGKPTSFVGVGVLSFFCNRKREALP